MAAKADEEKSLLLQIKFLTQLINKHKQEESTKAHHNFKYVNPLSTHNIKKVVPSSPSSHKLVNLQNVKMNKKRDPDLKTLPVQKKFKYVNPLTTQSIKNVSCAQNPQKLANQQMQSIKKVVSCSPNSHKLINQQNVDVIKKPATSLKTHQVKHKISTDINISSYREPATILNPFSLKKTLLDPKMIPVSAEKDQLHANKLSKNPYSLINNPHHLNFNHEVLQRDSRLHLSKDFYKKKSNSKKYFLNAPSCTTRYKPTVISETIHPQKTPQMKKSVPLKRLNRYKLIKTNLLSSKKVHPPPVTTRTVLQPKSVSEMNKVKIGRFLVCQSTCTSPQLVKLSRHQMVRMNMPSKVTRKVNRYKLEQKITALPIYTNKIPSNSILSKKSKSDFIFKRSWSSTQFGTKPMPVIFHSKYAISRMFKKNTPVKKLTSNLKENDKLIVIGGLMYKCSRNKLSRTNQAVLNKKQPQLIVKSWNPKKARIIIVRGIKFEVDPSGHHLQKISPTSLNDNKCASINSPNLSRVDLGGVTYVQKQPGLFVKSLTTYTRSLASRVLHRSINRVQAAKFKKDKKQQYCMFFNRFGKCNKQNICPYIHDPDKIAVCTRFLRGTCHLENCPFSHKISKEKMPVCSFFLRGICIKDDCPYLHANVGPNAEVCKDFLKGYCAHGEKCKKRHVLACEEFEKTGRCKHGTKCPLAFQRIKANKRKTFTIPNATSSEMSSPNQAKSNKRIIEDEEPDNKTLKRLPSFISLANVSISELDNPVDSKSEEPEKVLKIRPQFLKL